MTPKSVRAGVLDVAYVEAGASSGVPVFLLVLYLVFSRQLIRGITAGAVK